MNSEIYDVIIIGSGPAGYNSALYCSRGMLKTLLFEGEQSGGQLITTTEVENYLGFPDGINGYELTDIFKRHAEKFGTITIPNKVTKVNFNKYPFEIESYNDKYYSRSVIIATGASAKRLGIINEDLLWNKGISACAVCDGALPIFRNKSLIVVGGGDTACEEAIFLSKYASKVYMLLRSNKFRASKIMEERVKNNPKIEIIYNVILKEANGENKVDSAQIMNVLTYETTKLDVSGIFYGIGHNPNTEIFKDQIECDENGYIKVHNGTHTNINGIFAAGDVMDTNYRQAITAASFGCMASHDVQNWLNK